MRYPKPVLPEHIEAVDSFTTALRAHRPESTVRTYTYYAFRLTSFAEATIRSPQHHNKRVSIA